jgi:hypothetical protein
MEQYVELLGRILAVLTECDVARAEIGALDVAVTKAARLNDPTAIDQMLDARSAKKKELIILEGLAQDWFSCSIEGLREKTIILRASMKQYEDFMTELAIARNYITILRAAKDADAFEQDLDQAADRVNALEDSLKVLANTVAKVFHKQEDPTLEDTNVI